MTNEDKTIFMDEIMRLYLESKKNRRKWVTVQRLAGHEKTDGVD